MKRRFCRFCGDPFYYDTNGERKYCSDECKVAFNKRNRSNLLWKDVGVQCESCGNFFETKTRGANMCPKCARKRKEKTRVICECCGYNYRRALHSHHYRGKHYADTITLCANCHQIFHSIYGSIREKDYSREEKSDVIYDIKSYLDVVKNR